MLSAEAVVGQPRAEPFLRLAPPKPWWMEYAVGDLPEDVLDLAVVELSGEVVHEAAESEPGVFRLEALAAEGPGLATSSEREQSRAHPR